MIAPPDLVESIPNSMVDNLLEYLSLQPSNQSNNKVDHDGTIVVKAEPPRNTKPVVESELSSKDHLRQKREKLYWWKIAATTHGYPPVRRFLVAVRRQNNNAIAASKSVVIQRESQQPCCVR